MVTVLTTQHEIPQYQRLIMADVSSPTAGLYLAILGTLSVGHPNHIKKRENYASRFVTKLTGVRLFVGGKARFPTLCGLKHTEEIACLVTVTATYISCFRTEIRLIVRGPNMHHQHKHHETGIVISKAGLNVNIKWFVLFKIRCVR